MDYAEKFKRVRKALRKQRKGSGNARDGKLTTSQANKRKARRKAARGQRNAGSGLTKADLPDPRDR